jgi:hypothetical protein
MNKICEDFLAARLPIPGVVACAVRLPGGMMLDRCFERWLSPAQVRQALIQLTQSHHCLHQHQLAPIRVAWLFEHLRVETSLRPDNACLALFLQNRIDLAFGTIENVLTEFANLPAPVSA